jgi:type II secretory ATPase GspE/PulE/Tfp pilus assembly ATPase PilB-like protein
MSDLSLQPLNEPDPSGPAAGSQDVRATESRERKTQHQHFRWPMPPYASYPGALEQHEPLTCEIEGLNGRLMRGRLIFFVPEESVAHVQVPPARTTMPLRFSQFRSLTITQPVGPDPASLDDPHAIMLDERPRVPYVVHLSAGGTLNGDTIGHVEQEYGLFLFPPQSEEDAVNRMFVPREAYLGYEVGDRIGDVLVAGQAVTPEQVEQAAVLQKRLRNQKLGDILLTKKIVSPEQLLSAIEQQSKMPMVRIGEALIALDLITQPQLDEALEQQKNDRTVPLGEILVRHEMVTRQDLQTALARKMGYPLVDVQRFPVEAAALRKVPYVVADRLRALPLLMRDGTMIVAVEDPGRRLALAELEFVTQCKVVPVLAQHTEIDGAVQDAYSKIGADVSYRVSAVEAPAIEFEQDDSGRLVETLEREGQESQSEDDHPIEQSDNSLVRLINTMIIEAHADRVSDIHIESYPGRDKIKIRFRKDGILRLYLELPYTYRNAMISRIKIMCDLDISERRKPQDGKINFARFSPQHKIELRVATIPTNNGLEDVVMRILASAKPIPLDKLGLADNNFKRLKDAMERPYGLVLCVGPTGSGKTTTLHSALSHINVPERKIWTAEDPIEITQPGLRQVQVNSKIDWTFAKALRAFLRADPDVIMVGEIRDEETAHMAVEASLTGHLVLSTLHTNSAPETVTRLLDMGMDPFNFADSLLVVLAQRLVRRLCANCRVTEAMPDEALEELLADYLSICPPDDERFSREAVLADWHARFAQKGKLLHYHSPGCSRCENTGYKGRAGLHELMTISRDLRRLIQTGARAEELQACALREGMRTLRQDGIEKVLQGITGIEEVRATSNM